MDLCECCADDNYQPSCQILPINQPDNVNSIPVLFYAGQIKLHVGWTRGVSTAREISMIYYRELVKLYFLGSVNGLWFRTVYQPTRFCVYQYGIRILLGGCQYVTHRRKCMTAMCSRSRPRGHRWKHFMLFTLTLPVNFKCTYFS